MKKVVMIIFFIEIMYLHNATCMESLQKKIESAPHTCPKCPEMSSCSHITALERQKKSLVEQYCNIRNYCLSEFCFKTDCSDCNLYFQNKKNTNKDISKVCEEIASISPRLAKDAYYRGLNLPFEDPWNIRKYR